MIVLYIILFFVVCTIINTVMFVLFTRGAPKQEFNTNWDETMSEMCKRWCKNI